MKIILVAGLPGSGKTTWAKKRAEQKKSFLVDDPRQQSELPSMQFLEENLFEELLVVDPWFCLEPSRTKAESVVFEKYGIQPEWIFFENDVENCLYNSMIRDDGRMVVGFIETVSKNYAIPDEANVIPVWKGK